MVENYPVGATVSISQLESNPYSVLDRLRETEPVSWVPALNAWLVTDRDLAIQAMRDATTYTVQDPRFSTGAIMGPSMLSLDGPEHDRQRRPYATQFRPSIVKGQFEDQLTLLTQSIVDRFADRGQAELRTELAGPLAVSTIVRFLGLSDVDPDDFLGCYRTISDAIVGAATGQATPPACHEALDHLRRLVSAALHRGDSPTLQALQSDGSLTDSEIVTSTLVVMFGAIETSEGMTANTFWHLLTNPTTLARVKADRSLVPSLIEESLRLEPAAAVIDRYCTATTKLGPTTIPAGDMVTISLLSANRDPTTFPDPHLLNLDRTNLHQHVTFVQGPHGCLGLHLARLETSLAVTTVLDRFPDLALDRNASTPPTGLIFRKPDRLVVRWGDRQPAS